jgi:predicted CXXCH cytochrome family protein
MRSSKLLLAGAVLLLVAALAFAFSANTTQAATGIAGSGHDFSGKGWTVGRSQGNQICIYCHTPHNAPTVASGNNLIPLWNHATTSATFAVYTSASIMAVMGQPQGVSKACLSCHDGTVAIDSAAGSTGTNFMATVASWAVIPNDLSTTHPFSFAYNSTLTSADSTIVVPTKGTNSQYTVGGGTLPLFNGNMECATCHDPHNDVPAANGDFLRINNAGSALCLNCHIK